jgi:hypothetical protein
MTFLYTSPTVLPRPTKTQSLNTAVELELPEVKVCIFLTGKTGTSPSRSAARDKTCTTPVLPKRYSTMSLRLSMRVTSLSSRSLRWPPSGSPASIRSCLVSTNSLPSVYLTNPCFANFLRKTSEMALHSTMLWGSCIFAILAMFLSASGWSILLSAMTVGNFSSVKAWTTRSIVSLDQSCSGSFRFMRSRQRATTALVDPYPENWFCSVSTAVAFTAMWRRLMLPHLSIKLPWIQRTISLRSHTMSTLGS